MKTSANGLFDAKSWAKDIQSGDRRRLAQAITLVESRRPEDRAHSQALIREIQSRTGTAFRVGITGVPGVGKSSVIEELGVHLIQQGHRPAVLAIDPSSPRSGGSILADKTRMPQLARSPHAFIRPSPTSGFLGGIARWTRESVLLCESAGYDVILVETVGVGQSEIKVVDLVDCLVLMLLPGAGDAMQGIKRGIMEVADILVVNKADGAMQTAAELAVAELLRVVEITMGNEPRTPVISCSAHVPEKVATLWQEISDFKAKQLASKAYSGRRAQQRKRWMWREIEERLVQSFRHHPVVASQLNQWLEDVGRGKFSPEEAAEKLFQVWESSRN